MCILFAVQSLSVRFPVTPWTAARQASLSVTNSQSLLKLMSIKSVMPSNHLILCHPLWRGCLQWGCRRLPSIVPSIRVFSNESALCIRWSKYWSFSISSSSEYSGLISFWIDWFNLCSPRDSQESSPTPQLESINSSALKFLNGPTCKSVDNSYTTTWRNKAFTYTELCWQSDVSAFYFLIFYFCYFFYF